ncbi:MAG: hypothetical protein HYW07_13990 [Candidatus Latescibacteria bacterium]|nr:hypothetical protein [Candidatus Latescibacterota bacterium]
MAKYRTAIIACGTIGRVHARGWFDIPGQPTQIAAGSKARSRRRSPPTTTAAASPRS